LRREGIAVARCTIARLMRQMGLSGAVRGKAVKTTVSHPAVPCPRDKVNRQFQAPRPNALWVADFTPDHVRGRLSTSRLGRGSSTSPLSSTPSPAALWLAGLAVGRDRLCPRCPRTGAL
jgi:transposase InsO family protein